MPFLLLCALAITHLVPMPARLAARASGAHLVRQAASWQVPARPVVPWVRVFVTGYDDQGTTASGAPAGPGVVATDPTVIPTGDYVEVAGYGILRALDTGSLIKGLRVDIWLPTLAQCYAATGWRAARWSADPLALLASAGAR